MKTHTIPVCFTLLLAISGVMDAMSKEPNRSATTTVYFDNGGTVGSLTGDAAYFDDQSITCTAEIKDNSCNFRALYKDITLTQSVKFTPQ